MICRRGRPGVWPQKVHRAAGRLHFCERRSFLQGVWQSPMKTPLWFPQSFFSRTLWLVLIVVLFSKALTLVYLLMNEDVLVDRQYSHGVALTLRAYWAADESDRQTIADAAGLIRVVGGGVPEGEQHWPYSEIYQRQ